ncbi:hypothetical protein, partial [Falsochrobactrum ovis]|uniref:hypothetical protein n=1 Tax=Falsochrobactrum ovis TaxID=1293442 RepID=UPI001AECE713
VIFVDMPTSRISRQSMNHTGFLRGILRPIPEPIRPHGLKSNLWGGWQFYLLTYLLFALYSGKACNINIACDGI